METEKPFAVVTGAAGGMGLELARQFARDGFDLLIVSDGEQILEARQELEALGARVNNLQVNLATFDGVERLHQAIKADGRVLEAIAISAGAAASGDFSSTRLKEEISLINLNVVSVVHLTKCVLKEMVKNRRGRILFSAAEPSEQEAVAGATRAFVSAFAESIRKEAKPLGVSVSVLKPSLKTKLQDWARAQLNRRMSQPESAPLA